jgi:rubredoxin-NAD+ reductase
MKPIVIVGTGLAGYGTAREFRKHDTETPLVLITADDGVSYSKPMLSTATARGKSADELPQASAEEMESHLDV